MNLKAKSLVETLKLHMVGSRGNDKKKVLKCQKVLTVLYMEYEDREFHGIHWEIYRVGLDANCCKCKLNQKHMLLCIHSSQGHKDYMQ